MTSLVADVDRATTDAAGFADLRMAGAKRAGLSKAETS
jgi:hypothetical protein